MALIDAMMSTDLELGQEAIALQVFYNNMGQKYVKKTIGFEKVFEESFLMVKSNLEAKSIYPGISQINLGNESSYVMEYINGETLQQYFHKCHITLYEENIKTLMFKAIDKIKELHNATKENYTSGFHNTIVSKRLSTILSCPIIANHFKDIKPDGEDLKCTYSELKHYSIIHNGEIVNREPRKAYERSIKKYSRYLPKYESLIHGDPHFGNIMYDLQSDQIFFIDPRSSWDQEKNQKTGYFDPLYDIAAICHSFVANDNITREHHNSIHYELKQIHVDEQTLSLFEDYKTVFQQALKHYLSREAEKGELVRFLIYLACSLSGTMRYSIWAPSFNKLINMYLYSYLTLNLANET
jgi:hypothetical protein